MDLMQLQYFKIIAETESLTRAAKILHVSQPAMSAMLKKLEEETGMFGSISDEEVNTAAGKNYQDLTALRDPLMGLGYGEMNADTEPGAE